MFFNIEPFHFGIEDITAVFPSHFNCIEKYLNHEYLFGIMIDDTGYEREPFYVEEIQNWLKNSKFTDCLIINELQLQTIALELISHLPHQYFTNNSSYINIKLPSLRKPILLAKKLKNRGVKPSCAILTLSWYLLRLSTDFEIWKSGVKSSKIRESIISNCITNIQNQKLQYSSRVVNHLPKVFEKNEEKVSILFNNLIWNTGSYYSNDYIINYYY